MLRLAFAGTVLLAMVSAGAGAHAQDPQRPAVGRPPSPRPAQTVPASDDLRGRVVDIQQALDRILAEATPAPVGTSGARGAGPESRAAAATVSVDRARLLQLRQQLDALLTTLNKTGK